MAFDDLLANRVREALVHHKNLSEKKMFQGLCFLIDEKMCICFRRNELMCSIDPEKVESELEKGNSRQMMHNGNAMKGYIFVDEYGYSNPQDFKRLIELCLAFNKTAKSSKRKKQ